MASVLTMRQLYKKYNSFSYCNTSVLVDKQDISKIAEVEVLSCRVEETVEVKATYTSIELRADHLEKKLEDTFQIGSLVSIESGYENTKSTIFYGFLYSVSFKESVDQTAMIEIIAMDVLAIMMIGNQYTQKDQKKVSNLIKDMATNSTYKKYMSNMKIPVIPKSNDALIPVYLKSDYDMLYQIATTFQYEVFMSNKILYVGTVGQYSFNSITLDDNLGVFEKTMEVGLGLSIGQIQISGYDKQVKPITKKQKLSFSKFPATNKLDTIINNKTLLVTSSKIQDMASIDTLLKAHSQRLYDQFSTVSMVLIFLPEITCGSKIIFTMGSKKLTCYVKKVQHFLIDDAKTIIEGCLL